MKWDELEIGVHRASYASVGKFIIMVFQLATEDSINRDKDITRVLKFNKLFNKLLR